MEQKKEPIAVDRVTAEPSRDSGYRLVTIADVAIGQLSNALVSGELVAVGSRVFRVVSPGVGVWWNSVQSGPQQLSFSAELVNEELEGRLVEALRRVMWSQGGPETMTVRGAVATASHDLRASRDDLVAALVQLLRSGAITFPHTDKPSWNPDTSDDVFYLEQPSSKR